MTDRRWSPPRFVGQGLAGLDDVLSPWLPDLPDADQVTLRMVTNNTAGYPDYVQNTNLPRELAGQPFRQWTNQELIEIGLSMLRLFAPGTNWDSSHTNFVILGEALAKIDGKPLDVLVQEQVLGPMGASTSRVTTRAAGRLFSRRLERIWHRKRCRPLGRKRCSQ